MQITLVIVLFFSFHRSKKVKLLFSKDLWKSIGRDGENEEFNQSEMRI